MRLWVGRQSIRLQHEPWPSFLFERRVEALMPFIVACPVISFLPSMRLHNETRRGAPARAALMNSRPFVSKSCDSKGLRCSGCALKHTLGIISTFRPVSGMPPVSRRREAGRLTAELYRATHPAPPRAEVEAPPRGAARHHRGGQAR